MNFLMTKLVVNHLKVKWHMKDAFRGIGAVVLFPQCVEEIQHSMLSEHSVHMEHHILAYVAKKQQYFVLK